MKINLPDYVKTTLNILNTNGFEAWIVGGSIRDIVMGKQPYDYDIATNAKPEQVMNLFQETIPTGITHGTVTVIIDNKSIEITTYRTENGYSDSRHPESVFFVSNINDDLSRRDFTINAIAYNSNNELFDPYNGIEDINNKILRTVGTANKRFSEDALRILRLFRFSSQLDFKIEDETLNAAIKTAFNLQKISRERIREEFLKTLCGKNPFILNELIKNNSLNFIDINNNALIPEIICNTQPIKQIRLSYYCIINNIDASNLCKHLKTSRVFMDECNCICNLYKYYAPKTKIEIKKILASVKLEYFKNYVSLYESINNTNIISSLLSEILQYREPYKIEMLDITGNDLINLGYKGKDIGKTLNNLLNIVIENPKSNNKIQLLNLL